MSPEFPLGDQGTAMTSDDSTIVERIIHRLKDGSLPPESCANCNGPDAKYRSLYAICARATRRWESRGGGFVGGMLMGIPFLFPTPPEETIEIRDGSNVVVPVPLRVCDDCSKELDGGFAARVLAFISQVMFLAGLAMIVVWAIAKIRGTEISFLYAVACFGGFIPFHAASEWLQAQWPRRIKGILIKVSDYAALFAEYPGAEVVTKPPTALITNGDAAQQ